MAGRALIGATLGPLAEKAADLVGAQGYAPVLLGALSDEDIACGLAHVDNDVCVAAIAAIGQYLRVLESAEGGYNAAVAPELCKDCRSVCLSSLMRSAFARAGFGDVEVVELTSADVASCCPPPAAARVAKGSPVVGVCGNVPVLTTRLFNKTVVERLHEAGCQTLVPPLAYLVHDSDFLTPAVQYFHDAGVRTAICIVPFGCLGGHVYARGQLRKLQRAYPDVELTILDYDPSASDINVVNRTELIIQFARGLSGDS